MQKPGQRGPSPCARGLGGVAPDSILLKPDRSSACLTAVRQQQCEAAYLVTQGSAETEHYRTPARSELTSLRSRACRSPGRTLQRHRSEGQLCISLPNPGENPRRRSNCTEVRRYALARLHSCSRRAFVHTIVRWFGNPGGISNARFSSGGPVRELTASRQDPAPIETPQA